MNKKVKRLTLALLTMLITVVLATILFSCTLKNVKEKEMSDFSIDIITPQPENYKNTKNGIGQIEPITLSRIEAIRMKEFKVEAEVDKYDFKETSLFNKNRENSVEKILNNKYSKKEKSKYKAMRLDNIMNELLLGYSDQLEAKRLALNSKNLKVLSWDGNVKTLQLKNQSEAFLTYAKYVDGKKKPYPLRTASLVINSKVEVDSVRAIYLEQNLSSIISTVTYNIDRNNTSTDSKTEVNENVLTKSFTYFDIKESASNNTLVMKEIEAPRIEIPKPEIQSSEDSSEEPAEIPVSAIPSLIKPVKIIKGVQLRDFLKYLYGERKNPKYDENANYETEEDRERAKKLSYTRIVNIEIKYMTIDGEIKTTESRDYNLDDLVINPIFDRATNKIDVVLYNKNTSYADHIIARNVLDLVVTAR